MNTSNLSRAHYDPERVRQLRASGMGMEAAKRQAAKESTLQRIHAATDLDALKEVMSDIVRWMLD